MPNRFPSRLPQEIPNQPPEPMRAMRRRALLGAVASAWAGAAVGALLIGPATVRAQPAAPSAALYREIPETFDGIGKSYLGRPISRVMGWQGAAWLERDEREQEERGELLLRELQLKPGMDVADVGAGTGYYSRRIAPLVAAREAGVKTGRVYAVDVQPQMLRVLQEAAKKPGLDNIVPVLGAVDDVKLPPASVDLAIMVDVYHELEFPHEVMTSLVRAVRPGGRIVFVEYRAEDPRVPIKPLHKMSEAQIKLEAAQHPLAWERTAGGLPWQHVVVFTRR